MLPINFSVYLKVDLLEPVWRSHRKFKPRWLVSWNLIITATKRENLISIYHDILPRFSRFSLEIMKFQDRHEIFRQTLNAKKYNKSVPLVSNENDH